MVGVPCSQLLMARQHLQLRPLPCLTLSLLCIQHHCCGDDCSHWVAAFFGCLQSLQLARDWRPASLGTGSSSCCSCDCGARHYLLQLVRNLTASKKWHVGGLLLRVVPISEGSPSGHGSACKMGAGSYMPGTGMQASLIAEGTHAPEDGGSARRAAAAGSGGRHWGRHTCPGG